MSYVIKSIFQKGKRIGWRVMLMHKLYALSLPVFQNLSGNSRAPWEVSTKQLLAYPINSLGRALGCFLQQHNYILIDKFESHDVFHILLGYKPVVIDEARMQYCLWGSGRRSLYACGICIVSGIMFPELWVDFKYHYQRGRGLYNFSDWDFEALLSADIHQLQKSIVR
ncbi:MAG TPA: hypothetical protein EYG68_12100 [Leucothrix mucor]|nr:hypothetical protein [Leucothrix mucor]